MFMKIVKNILKYTVFFALGAYLFWNLYKDIDLEKLKIALLQINYFWIGVSICLGLLSHWSRAIRWKMLIKPLGYNPRVINIFLSIMVLYLTNLLIPRAGEVARCTILGKYEKIPVSKLIGTMIVERIADFLTMIFLLIMVLTINISIVKTFFVKHIDLSSKFINLLSITNILLAISVIVLLVVIFYLVRPLNHSKINDKISGWKVNFIEGIQSILRLENKWYFILHTLFIFLMWLLMLYVVFLAFPPTANLTIWAGMFTFMMGGLAMLAPVQGGVGAWHFMVIQSLLLFGISEIDGKTFALVAHTSTNMIYLIFGLLALLIFPMINKKESTIIK